MHNKHFEICHFFSSLCLAWTNFLDDILVIALILCLPLPSLLVRQRYRVISGNNVETATNSRTSSTRPEKAINACVCVCVCVCARARMKVWVNKSKRDGTKKWLHISSIVYLFQIDGGTARVKKKSFYLSFFLFNLFFFFNQTVCGLPLAKG
jgi:hypothetical protein